MIILQVTQKLGDVIYHVTLKFNNSHYDEEVSYATFGEMCDLETEGNQYKLKW